MSQEFNLEAAKRGEPIEHLSVMWGDVEFVGESKFGRHFIVESSFSIFYTTADKLRMKAKPHPHQKWIDMAKADPELKWQTRDIGDERWEDAGNPLWYTYQEYRPKPKTVKIDDKKSQQHTLMKFDPAFKTIQPYPSHAAQWRDWHGEIAWLFNPWDGSARSPLDIGSDPFGMLIIPESEPLYAAKKVPA